MGGIHGALGEFDRAFKILQEGAATSAFAPFLAAHPFTDPMRSDPRFDKLMKKLGLEDYPPNSGRNPRAIP